MPIEWGLDLDGSLVSFVPHFAEWLRKRLNISFNDSDITTYEWHESVPEIGKGRYYRELEAFTEAGGYALLTPYEGASEFINSLNGSYRFITARPDECIPSTVKFFNQHGWDTSKLIFANKHSNHKAIASRRFGITKFIEDAPKHAINLANAGINVYLVDAPYNQNVVHDNIIRINNVRDLHASANQARS